MAAVAPGTAPSSWEDVGPPTSLRSLVLPCGIECVVLCGTRPYMSNIVKSVNIEHQTVPFLQHSSLGRSHDLRPGRSCQCISILAPHHLTPVAWAFHRLSWEMAGIAPLGWDMLGWDVSRCRESVRAALVLPSKGSNDTLTCSNMLLLFFFFQCFSAFFPPTLDSVIRVRHS